MFPELCPLPSRKFVHTQHNTKYTYYINGQKQYFKTHYNFEDINYHDCSFYYRIDEKYIKPGGVLSNDFPAIF